MGRKGPEGGLQKKDRRKLLGVLVMFIILIVATFHKCIHVSNHIKLFTLSM